MTDHDTAEEMSTESNDYARAVCADCGWTNTNPPADARSFGDAHARRHYHTVEIEALGGGQ